MALKKIALDGLKRLNCKMATKADRHSLPRFFFDQGLYLTLKLLS